MKLPHCEYPSKAACGPCADPLKRVFNHLWTALDGNIDAENIDPEFIGPGLEIVKMPASGGGTRRKLTNPLATDEDSHFAPKKEAGVVTGMEVFVPSTGRFCVVQNETPDTQSISLVAEGENTGRVNSPSNLKLSINDVDHISITDQTVAFSDSVTALVNWRLDFQNFGHMRLPNHLEHLGSEGEIRYDSSNDMVEVWFQTGDAFLEDRRFRNEPDGYAGLNGSLSVSVFPVWSNNGLMESALFDEATASPTSIRTGRSMIRFGTGAGDPAIKKSGAALHVRLANDTDYAELRAAGIVGTGDVVGANVGVSPNTGAFYWNSRSVVRSPSDGTITLYNNANTGFTRLQFGGTGAGFPSLLVNGTEIRAQLANGGGASNFGAKRMILFDGADSPGIFYASSAGATRAYTHHDASYLVTVNATGQGILNYSQARPSENSLAYRFHVNSGNQQVIDIMHDRRVGINRTPSAYTLEVEGDLMVTTNIEAGAGTITGFSVIANEHVYEDSGTPLIDKYQLKARTAKGYLSTDATTTDSSEMMVPFDSILYDDLGGGFLGGSYEIPEDGLYEVRAVVGWVPDSNIAGHSYLRFLVDEAVEEGYFEKYHSAETSRTSTTELTARINLQAGDLIGVTHQFVNESGTIYSNRQKTYFEITKVGPFLL